MGHLFPMSTNYRCLVPSGLQSNVQWSWPPSLCPARWLLIATRCPVSCPAVAQATGQLNVGLISVHYDSQCPIIFCYDPIFPMPPNTAVAGFVSWNVVALSTTSAYWQGFQLVVMQTVINFVDTYLFNKSQLVSWWAHTSLVKSFHGFQSF